MLGGVNVGRDFTSKDDSYSTRRRFKAFPFPPGSPPIFPTTDRTWHFNAMPNLPQTPKRQPGKPAKDSSQTSLLAVGNAMGGITGPGEAVRADTVAEQRAANTGKLR
jgi:hypothetical protein